MLPNKTYARFIKHGLRLLISLVLVYLIYHLVDSRELLRTLSIVSIHNAILIALIYAGGQMLSVVKWRIFVQNVKIDRSFLDTTRAYFCGMFVNTFGLGTVGGDVTRGLALKPKRGERASALATVVADRIHGLLVLALIGSVSIMIVRPAALGDYATGLSALLVIGLISGWMLGPAILVKLFPADHRFGSAAAQVALAFPRNPKTLFLASVISFVFHSTQICLHYYIAQILGAPLSLAYLFATVPVTNIICSLPISVNGLGVREALYLFLFVPMGLSQETAVAFGAIWILAITAVSAIGGLILLPSFAEFRDDIQNGFPEKETPAQETTHDRQASKRYAQR